ncbi:2-hydroxy-3-oxopropionate reductase [Shouchella clausii]|uniref:2-hydroxy-3-oxopropionate reductase n=1 Tax=Shouchella clausii TaxID=79880 RepID=UPI003461C40F
MTEVMEMKIGLIGLGIMGKPMAKNIIKGGYSDLMVNDLNQASVKELVELGATAGTNAEIGSSCDLIMTMLPNSPHVKAVMLGENGVANYMKAGQVFIDMSSINPVASKEIAAELEKKGIEMLDAPVSGGEPKAIDGTLSIMVGGKQNVFDKYKPLLETMGASVVRCGKIGAGNTTKLANQIIVACNIQALAEALTLAQKAGVDPQLVFEAIRGGLAGSTVMNAKAPMMISGNAEPGFKIDLHIKDLNNALDCAHTVGALVPMTAGVQEILQYLHHSGHGQDDHSAIAKYYENLTGIRIGRPSLVPNP